MGEVGEEGEFEEVTSDHDLIEENEDGIKDDTYQITPLDHEKGLYKKVKKKIKETNSNHDSIEEENNDDTVLNPPLEHEEGFDKKVEDVKVAKSEACDDTDAKKRNDFKRFLRFKKNK